MSKVGGEILAYCTSCKLDLAHIIVSKMGTKISKVECKTCKKTHKYSAPKGEKDGQKAIKEKKKRATKKAQKASSTKSVQDEWQELMAQKKEQPSKKYSMKDTYEVGDVISHSKFGDGIVRRLIYPNKIDIIFSNDIKLLVHGKQ